MRRCLHVADARAFHRLIGTGVVTTRDPPLSDPEMSDLSSSQLLCNFACGNETGSARNAYWGSRKSTVLPSLMLWPYKPTGPMSGFLTIRPLLVPIPLSLQ